MLTAPTPPAADRAMFGLADYIPRGPTLSEVGAARWLAADREPVSQRGPPSIIPLPPFQPFAAHYQVDLVVEPRDARWQMHELARVRIGDRELWLAKDSDRDGVQTVTVDVEDPDTWLPEVPVPRRRGRVEVVDRSTAARLDVGLEWTAPDGRRVALAFAGRLPAREEGRRNGSTFHHSDRAASVLLDVRRKRLGRATLSIGGRPTPVRRVLGLVPVQAVLVQTQAGLAAASMALRPVEGGLEVVRPHPGVPWPTRGVERWSWDGVDGTGTLTRIGVVGATRFTFVRGGLAGIAVLLDELGAVPAFALELSAPLPDLGRAFAGPVRRRFVARVNGLLHGHGAISAARTGERATIALRPAAPRWFAARPVESTVTPSDGGHRLESRIRGLEPPLRA